MSDDAEFILKSDRTEAVGELHVARERRSDNPPIELRPSLPGIVAGRGGDSGAGGEFSVVNPDGSVVGAFHSREGTGTLDIFDEDRNSVRIDSDSEGRGRIQVRRAAGSGPAATDDIAVRIHSTDDGGRLSLVGEADRAERLVAAATADGGKLTVKAPEGVPTGQLGGGDASLVLTGIPETPDRFTNDAGAERSTEWGGGELVVSEYASEVGDEDPETVPRDIHIHARAEKNSKYGVDDDNRPRIFLDGPTATLELGRGEVAENRVGLAGGIKVRDSDGELVLELDVDTDGGENFGRVRFLHNDGDGTEFRGSIRAHPEGLMLYDSTESPALLITQSGAIETREPIEQNL